MATDFLIKSIMIQWKYPNIAFSPKEKDLATTNGINDGYITGCELVGDPDFNINSSTQPEGYKTIKWKDVDKDKNLNTYQTEQAQIDYLTLVKSRIK